MARTIAECNDYIVTNLVTQFAAQGITITPTTWSTRNMIRLICYTFAIAQALLEQIQDVFIAKSEAIQAASSAGSVPWIQDRVLKFQYSSTNPQYLSVISGLVQYAIVNTAYRIVTACAVSSSVTNIVNIKAAKGATTLGALSAPELAALQSYCTLMFTSGVTYNVTSIASDKLYIAGTIYYKGVYSAVIQANVIAAIEDYLYNLSKTNFGGDILTSDIISLIRNIEGVNDFVPDRIALRYNSQGVLGGIDLVLGSDILNRKYNSLAGYIEEETTALYTFTDTLTFVPE